MTDDAAKRTRLESLLLEYQDRPKTWVLQAISNCVLGDSEGYQKKTYRHVIKRLLDPLRVEPEHQIDSLLLLAHWKHGTAEFPITQRKQKGRSWWAIHFPYFNLVGRGNRPKTVLHLNWNTIKTERKRKKGKKHVK